MGAEYLSEPAFLPFLPSLPFSPSGFLPTRRELPWLLAGIALAAVWFAFNRSMPPLFRGDVCCDSTAYVKIGAQIPAKAAGTATQAHSNLLFSLIAQAFSYAGYTPPGFPLFLAITHGATHFLRLDLLFPWLDLSLFLCFLLYLCAAFFFYRSLRALGLALHPAALLLLTGHPGLVSLTAIPLADGLASIMAMLAAGALCRSVAATEKRKIAWAAAAGILLGLTVFTRTSHLIASVLCITVWLLVGLRQRRKSTIAILAPCVCLLAFTLTLSPRLIACSTASHSFCYSLPEDKLPLAVNLLQEGLRGGRTFTVLAPNNFSRLVTLTDPFFWQFSAACAIHSKSYVRELASCMARHPILTAIFAAKKSVGLFDNFYLNSYATYVSPPWSVAWNRLFGLIGYVGFFSLFGILFWEWFGKHRGIETLVPFAYPLAYFGYSALLMIESRYGLPLAPFGIAGFVLLVTAALGHRGRTLWMIIMVPLALAALFLTQVIIWDISSTLPYRSIQDALNPRNPPPEIVSPLRVVQ